MPDRYSVGLGPRNPIGDVEHVEWLDIGNWATRTVCKWSKYLMWLWSIWTEELGLLGAVYISNLRVPQFAVFW